MTTAHEATDHASLPLANNLLTAFAHSDEAKEWYYMTDGANKDTKEGPLTKDSLKYAFTKRECWYPCHCLGVAHAPMLVPLLSRSLERRGYGLKAWASGSTCGTYASCVGLCRHAAKS
eukprot:scaffold434_cov358-Prasinococcus_capsulatus_cf.AAC.10